MPDITAKVAESGMWTSVWMEANDSHIAPVPQVSPETNNNLPLYLL